jgi:hypothetical protein
LFAVLDNGALGFAVLAHEPVENAQARLDRVGIGSGLADLFLTPCDVRCQVLDLRIESGEPLGDACGRGVESRQLRRRAGRPRDRVTRSAALPREELMGFRQQSGDALRVASQAQAPP